MSMNLKVKWDEEIIFTIKYNLSLGYDIFKKDIYNNLIRLSPDYKNYKFDDDDKFNVQFYTVIDGSIVFLTDNQSLQEYIQQNNQFIYCQYIKNYSDIYYLNLITKFNFNNDKMKWYSKTYEKLKNIKGNSLNNIKCYYIFQLIELISENFEVDKLNYFLDIFKKDISFKVYFYRFFFDIMSSISHEKNGECKYLYGFLYFLAMYKFYNDNYFSVNEMNNIFKIIQMNEQYLEESMIVVTMDIFLLDPIKQFGFFDDYDDDDEDDDIKDENSYLYGIITENYVEILSESNNNKFKSLIPHKKEIFTSECEILKELKGNKIKGYESVDEYANTHYNLYRSDLLIPLQKAIIV